MAAAPKVSVIVAVGNDEKHLRACLESIVHQTLDELEVLCVNCGSTDTSLDIVNEFAWKDPRFTVFAKDCRNVCAARNLGIHAAGGEYLAFATANGQYCDSRALELMVSKASEQNAALCRAQGNGFDRAEAAAAPEEGWRSFDEAPAICGIEGFICLREEIACNELFFDDPDVGSDALWLAAVMRHVGRYYSFGQNMWSKVADSASVLSREELFSLLSAMTEVVRLAMEDGNEALVSLVTRHVLDAHAEDLHPYLLKGDAAIVRAVEDFGQLARIPDAVQDILCTLLEARERDGAEIRARLEDARARTQDLRTQGKNLMRACYAQTKTLDAAKAKLTAALEAVGELAGAKEPKHPVNILPYPFVHGDREKDGIVWKDLGYGRIEAHGTATASTTFDLTRPMARTSFATGQRTFVVSLGTEGASSSTWYVSGKVGNKNGGPSALLRKRVRAGSSGFGDSFELDTAGYEYFGRLYIVVKAGQTFNHQVFTPMICPAEEWTGQWVPYVPELDHAQDAGDGQSES